MKNVYIMGAGKFGKYVYDQLFKYRENWNVIGYIDSDISKKGVQKNGLKIYHLFESEIKGIDSSTVVFIAIASTEGKLKIIYQLIRLGFCNIFEIRNSVLVNSESFVTSSGLKEKAVKQYKTGEDGRVLPVFEYLETHVVNGCNLRCKGCSHFSNLFAVNDIVEFEEFKKDIIRLGEICNIRLFRILGGEPLLNESLIKYLKVVRDTFPATDIHIATNGLLLLKGDEDLLRYISENAIVLDITMYKPSVNLKEEIVRRLDSCKVIYSLDKENLSVFNKVLTLNGNNNAINSVNACERKKCLILKSGCLYRCPISAYVERYNEQYGTNIENEKLFDIYLDSREHLWKIALENPIKPVLTCKYCVNKPVYFEWEQSINPQKEDWLV